MTLPTVPTTVWEQISVVITFAFLLAGLWWVLIKIFTGAISQMNTEHSKSVSEINLHYSNLIKDANTQWQLYFDARSKNTEIIDTQIVAQLKDLTNAISDLSRRNDKAISEIAERHAEHDTMVRTALDAMAEKRKPLSKNK